MNERRLEHREEAENFYRDLRAQGVSVRVGMEASGHARWFERLLGDLQFELWIGDAADRTKRVRKQKTDRQDAQLLPLEVKKKRPGKTPSRFSRRDVLQHLYPNEAISALPLPPLKPED